MHSDQHTEIQFIPPPPSILLQIKALRRQLEALRHSAEDEVTRRDGEIERLGRALAAARPEDTPSRAAAQKMQARGGWVVLTAVG